jgi:hypothetical protein
LLLVTPGRVGQLGEGDLSGDGIAGRASAPPQYAGNSGNDVLPVAAGQAALFRRARTARGCSRHSTETTIILPKRARLIVACAKLGLYSSCARSRSTDALFSTQ